jgi:hypothetical protein
MQNLRIRLHVGLEPQSLPVARCGRWKDWPNLHENLQYLRLYLKRNVSEMHGGFREWVK